MKRCFQDMKWPASIGAGFSVRSVVCLAGTIVLRHSLQSWVCLINDRPDDLSRSLPTVLLFQINSKRNLHKLFSSLGVHYLFSGLERERISLYLALSLLFPNQMASAPCGDSLPLTCFFAWGLLMRQVLYQFTIVCWNLKYLNGLDYKKNKKFTLAHILIALSFTCTNDKFCRFYCLGYWFSF